MNLAVIACYLQRLQKETAVNKGIQGNLTGFKKSKIFQLFMFNL